MTNIGDKLRTLASICALLGGAIIILGLLMSLGFGSVIFLALMLPTGIGILICYWILYAFAQLVDDIHAIRHGTNGDNPDFGHLPGL